MRKRDFEKCLRKKFDDAQIGVPDGVWTKIEHHLLSADAFEANLQQKFDESEIAPPKDLWISIETELTNAKERKPIFWLIFNKWTVTGIAALLIISFGILFRTVPEKESQTSENNTIFDADSSNHRSPEQSDKVATIATTTDRNATWIANKRLPKTKSSGFIANQKPKEFFSTQPLLDIHDTIEHESQSLPEITKISLKYLQPAAYFHFANSFTLRRDKLAFIESVKKEGRHPRHSWLGMFTGIMPFDANLTVHNLERVMAISASQMITSEGGNGNPGVGGSITSKPMLSETFVIPLSQPHSEMKNGKGINLGFNFGKIIGKMFALETRLRYFSGTARINSNVHAFNEKTGNVETFLESQYIRNEGTAENITIANDATVNNRYRYLMLPVQVSFRLPLTQKIELSVGSGLSTDVFLGNTFENSPYRKSKVTAKNSVYRLFNLSGLASLNATYLISENWQVMVSGQYQQNLTATKNTEDFSYKPHYIGLCSSINYQFK